MYRFETKQGLVFTTEYSPKQIAKFVHFDGFDARGDRFVIEIKKVNFKTFEYVER